MFDFFCGRVPRARLCAVSSVGPRARAARLCAVGPRARLCAWEDVCRRCKVLFLDVCVHAARNVFGWVNVHGGEGTILVDAVVLSRK